MKKTIKLTESDLYKIVNKVLREQAALKPNPVASNIPGKTQNPALAKKLPTDFTKTVAFLLPNNVYLALTPLKQDISKQILNYIGIGADLPTNNKINVLDKGSVIKECDKKIVFFTSKPNQQDFNNWCSAENINPSYLKKQGIFEIPKDPRFYIIGNYKTIPKQ